MRERASPRRRHFADDRGWNGLPPVAAPSLCAGGALAAAMLPERGVSKPLPQAPTVLVFDSGVGGLSVFRHVVAARPDGRFVYVADDALFPYGGVPEADLLSRVTALMGDLIAEHRPDLVVIACNTASTIVMPALRARFAVPFVGTVPAIKPACAASLSKKVSVLGTEATVAREYTKMLIRDFASACEVTLVGSRRLAAVAEAYLSGEAVDEAEIAAEIAPCFVDRAGSRTDTIVLACTHYPLLLAQFERLAAWPVRWIDPAPAIARRVTDLLAPRPRVSDPRTEARFMFTSGRAPSPALLGALARFGLTASTASTARIPQ